MFALVLFLAAAIPPKSQWTPAMCGTAVDNATPAYISYCIAHSKAYPACPANGHDPREMMWAAQADGTRHHAYFEVLDCSWHPGDNPRDAVHKH